MIRMTLAAVGIALLPTNSVLAQSNCDQIRQAVATYGYAAARAHARAHYGEAALREGDKCFPEMHPTETPRTETHRTEPRRAGTHRTKKPRTETQRAETQRAETQRTKK
jgi:hypothetical protein